MVVLAFKNVEVDSDESCCVCVIVDAGEVSTWLLLMGESKKLHQANPETATAYREAKGAQLNSKRAKDKTLALVDAVIRI